ncbi:YmfQ family protein [Paenibacillus sp. CMAA1739]|uniref:YmfQ family protein n=1 Tax=Paenibacillus ottowii TaxID=2315729 RepID=UPI002731CEFB|nr:MULTISPECIES: YmfQ family protein [Paenibacillus]MDP1509820.1 YmfQ family protein [Paenibacillus ottowii]MEC4567205.1 YmfQ family protein [Paenibacillus sp. CMAA1739]
MSNSGMNSFEELLNNPDEGKRTNRSDTFVNRVTLAEDGLGQMSSERGRELLSYLPAYYETSRVMRSDMDAKGSELDALYLAMDATVGQFFVRTATWGLERWEMELGIETDLAKPLDQRRAVVESKLRGAGTFSGQLVKNVAEAYDGGTVEVTFHPAEWGFTVKFIDTIGIPPNVDDLKAAIEEIKPAHMAVEYKLRYLTIAEVESMTLYENEHTTQDRYLGGGA